MSEEEFDAMDPFYQQITSQKYLPKSRQHTFFDKRDSESEDDNYHNSSKISTSASSLVRKTETYENRINVNELANSSRRSKMTMNITINCSNVHLG